MPTSGKETQKSAIFLQLSQGVLDEYSECARMPTKMASEVLQYRELWQLFGTKEEKAKVNRLLVSFVSKVLDGSM